METVQKKPEKITQFFKKDFYEKSVWDHSALLVGLDEVGRGCSAGPVTAAAVVLYPGKKHVLLRDSKELTPQERIKAYNWIIKNSWYALASVHHRAIDDYNIYASTQRAMKRALAQLYQGLPIRPELILIDALPLQPENFYAPILYFYKGETKSSSIAAASIVAKVTRDACMSQLAQSFPGYRLDVHKGYCTASHRHLVGQHGASFIHRKSYIHTPPKKEDSGEQQTVLW